MIKSKKKCDVSGCNFGVFSGSKCYYHHQKKPLKKSNKSIKKVSEKGLEKKKLKTEKTKKLHEWFQELWENEPHYSEVSGKWLGNSNSSAFWHHIISKSSTPEAEFDRENIIRLTLDEHTQVEFNPTIFEEVNQRRVKLKQKYGK